MPKNALDSVGEQGIFFKSFLEKRLLQPVRPAAVTLIAGGGFPAYPRKPCAKTTFKAKAWMRHALEGRMHNA